MMKKLLFLLFIVILAMTLKAEWITVSRDNTSELITYQQTRGAEIELTFHLDGYEQDKLIQNDIEYTKLSHQESGSLCEEGKPDLPVFTKIIAIPAQGDINQEILSYQSRQINDIVIYPCERLDQDSNTQERFIIDENYYRNGGIFPSDFVCVGEPAIMRDLRVLPVTFCPFRYNAETKNLEIYTEISVNISVTGNSGINCKTRSGALSRSFEPLYRSNIINYNDTRMRDDYQLPVILVICPDDEVALENMQPLLDWKRQKGFSVVTATTTETGNNSDDIKAYIQNAYDNWENPPEYICLAGDATGSYAVATHYLDPVNSYLEGDQFYGELEGDDCLLDVHLGRLSYTTMVKLQVIVAKILYYEKNPYTENTDWLEHSLLIGDPASMGYITIENSLSIKELMLQYPDNWNSDDNFYEVYYSNFPDQMDAALEAGVSYMFYRGYIGVSSWDPGTQTNDFMLPFTTLIGCSTNNFAQGTSDPETMLRMGTVEVPRGAIGAIGQTSCANHTCFASALTIGMAQSFLFDQVYSMGAVLTSGKMMITQVYPYQEYVPEYLNLITLIGDPSLDLWTKIPADLTAVYPQQIALGDNWLPVLVLDDQDNPLPDAWVTLTATDPLDFSVSAFTDPAGNVILAIENIPQDLYILTVSCPNFIPVQYSIEAAPAEQMAEVSEALFIETIGNGDDILNPGETFDLDITLTNYGSQSLSGINAVISSGSSFIEILNSQLDFGNITAGNSANPAGNFSFSIDPAALEGMEAEFELVITDNTGNEWNSWLNAAVTGASVYCSYFSFSDDGILDPGETTELYIELTNNGSLPAPETQATLACYDSGIVIFDNQCTFNSISPGASVNNMDDTFTISASEYLLPGCQINLLVTLTTENGFNCPVQFTVSIGNPQVTDPCTNDAYGYICFDDEDTDYEFCPEYNWIEINPFHGGLGQSIPMSSGKWGGQSEVIDLPEDFNFKFYGEEYQQLTICSNGWVAPGYHETASYCNWYLPSPQGPSPIIAVFWDDLRVIDGDDNISWYYDDVDHWVIIEWYLSQDNISNDNKFQVILYDYLYYPNLLDNSNIKMQYVTVDNSNFSTNWQYHGQYATIGLENSDSSSGLLYTYNNEYSVTNKPLENEMALFFTNFLSDYDLPYLRINNVEIEAGDDEFIEADETVYLDLQLINNGQFAAHNLELEISCSDPYIVITQPVSHIDFIGIFEVAETLFPFIFNVLPDVPDFHDFMIALHLECDETIWDRYIPLTAYQPNTFSINQDSIYVEMNLNQTGSQEFILTNIGSETVNFYASTREIDPPDRDISNAYLTCSTNQFIPGETTDWNFTIVNSNGSDEWITELLIEFPYEVTLNYASDAIGGSGGDLVWDGITGTGVSVDWYGISPSGFGLIHSGETASFIANVTLNDQYAGDLDLLWQISGDGFGAEPHTVTGNVILQSPLRWINLDISYGSLEPEESQTFTIDLDSFNILPGIYNAEILISSDSWDQKTLPVTLNVLSNEETYDLLPEISDLLNNYPNPFNPSTTIRFAVSMPDSPVNISIYNIKGQRVRSFKIHPDKIGTKFKINKVFWDGKDDHGREIPSGVYLCQAKIAGKTFSRKMLLTK